MFDGQQRRQLAHGVGGGPAGHPAVFAGGPAPLQRAGRISLIREFACGGGRLLRRHLVEPGVDELLVDLPAKFGVEMAGFRGDELGDVFADLPAGQQCVGGG